MTVTYGGPASGSWSCLQQPEAAGDPAWWPAPSAAVQLVQGGAPPGVCFGAVSGVGVRLRAWMLLNTIGTALLWLCSQHGPHVKSATKMLRQRHSCARADTRNSSPLHKEQGYTGCAGI